MRIPKHIAVIPDGNRRWASQNGLKKEEGYQKGLYPGLEVFHICQELGIEEITYYGFTVDNTKRPAIQRISFTKACIEAVKLLAKENAELLVLGNQSSAMFPNELKEYRSRKKMNQGGTKINFLVNYSWEWDLNLYGDKTDTYQSKEVSRIDLIIRWGGRHRLSGLLPIQSVYSDFYFIDDYWPDYKKEHIKDALKWYQHQDITLGG